MWVLKNYYAAPQAAYYAIPNEEVFKGASLPACKITYTPEVRQGKLIVIIPVWLSGSEFLFVKTFAFNGNKRSDV